MVSPLLTHSKYHRLAQIEPIDMCVLTSTDSLDQKTLACKSWESCQMKKREQKACRHKLMGHYNDVIMSMMASQITSLAIVYSTVNSGAVSRKHQRSASLAFVWGIHGWPVNSPHKGPIIRKMFPFDDVIMHCWIDLFIWHDPCTITLIKIYPMYRHPI